MKTGGIKIKKLLVFLCAVAMVFGVAGTAQALPYVSTFTIDKADFLMTGFSYDDDRDTPRIPSSGPVDLDFTSVLGTYDLDIPPAGGSWDVFIVGSLWADFDKDGTWDAPLGFDEYVGNYVSPGPSTSWTPSFTDGVYTVDCDIDVDGLYGGPYSFGSGAHAYFDISGSAADMRALNSGLTYLDNTQGGGDGKFDWYVKGEITVTAVPEPATMLLLGSGLIGLAGLGRKKFFKKS